MNTLWAIFVIKISSAGEQELTELPAKRRDKHMKQHVTIAVGRQFGSGGREFGRRLAAALNINYYDKELLSHAARKSGLSDEFFERNDERAPGFLNGIFSFAMGYSPTTFYAGPSAISDDNIYSAQSDFIKSLAAQESCVIVGRTADYVLRDSDRLVSIFVHAPMADCVARIMSRNPDITAAKARQQAERVNKLRANYYNFYTDKTWGAAASYDLTFDTSLLSMDQLVELACQYVRMRYPEIF